MEKDRIISSIFIKESPSSEVPEFYGRTVNAFFLPEKNYLFDYFDFREFRSAYDRIFIELNGRLLENFRSGEISYRGIDLLSCFKFNLFMYASSSAIIGSALFNFKKDNPKDAIYVSGDEDEGDWDSPSIHQIIKACVPDIKKNVHIVKGRKPHLNNISGRNIISGIKDMVWPGKLSILSGKPSVVFFSDFQRIKSFLPLMRSSVVFFTDVRSPKILFRSLRERICYEQIAGAKDRMNKYADIALDFNNLAQKSNIFKDMKTDHCDLEIILKQKIDQLFKVRLPDLLCRIDKFHDFFIRKDHLRAVLLDEDITPNKNAFCQIASKHSVHSYVECHGALAGAYGYTPLTAYRIFVWGAEQKNRLIQWGCPPDKVIVSGCSRYRQYQKMSDADARKDVFRRFNFAENTKTILFAPHHSYDKRHFGNQLVFSRIQSILDVILKYPDIQIIIKLHPGDIKAHYYFGRCCQPDVRCRIKILKEFDTYLLTKASDFLIVHDSTMAIDGFALEKNVIFLPAIGIESEILKDSIWDFRKYNVFYCPSNNEEFRSIFEKLLLDSGARPKNARWDEARRQCLNEGTSLPEDIIASHILDAR